VTSQPPFRPWGELAWALGLSAPRRWHFFGCVATEDRSIDALLALHHMELIESFEMLRIIDTKPADSVAEEERIRHNLARCTAAGCSIQPTESALEAPLQNAAWKQRLDFPEGTCLCLDISSLPKRFFFQVIKAALVSPKVRDFVILYSKPQSYPDGSLAGNPGDWTTITGFGCEDPDLQSAAASHVIVGAGFAVEGLQEHVGNRAGAINVDVLIPFPAEPWRSVRRSWESAHAIEEALGADPEKGLSEVKPSYHQVGALDMSSAFDKLLNLTNNGTHPATLAPLGPKPLSVAMCLLASQNDRFPVYYAQPKTYALNYSTGCEVTYAYWIKHQGVNLYSTADFILHPS